MSKKHYQTSRMNTEMIISLVVIMVTTLGSTIPLYLYTANQTSSQIQAIQAEMKDFHGRLCAIEERNKK